MKLAQFTGFKNGATLYISPTYVIGIVQDMDGRTNIVTAEGRFTVAESVEEAADRIAAAYEA